MSLETRYVLALPRYPAPLALTQHVQRQHLFLGPSCPSLPARHKLLGIQEFIQRQSNCEIRIEFSWEKLISPSLLLQSPLSSPRCPQSTHYCLPCDNPGDHADSGMRVLPHEELYLLILLLSAPAGRPRYCPVPISALSLVSSKIFPSLTNRSSFLRQLPHSLR